MSTTEIFEPEGRAIPYAVEGTGPAVVLIPGRGLNISYLGLLAHSVSEEDFQMIRIGSRRPAPGVAVSMSDLAQDVVDVMDHLSVEDAWVGGHAFGGVIARLVSRAHPDRVNGVMLLGVQALPLQADTLQREVAEVPDVVRDADVDKLQINARATLADVELSPRIPVLVIQGTDDPVAPASAGDALQASAPGLVSVVRIDGGGYLFPHTHLGATSWAIEDYLDWD